MARSTRHDQVTTRLHRRTAAAAAAAALTASVLGLIAAAPVAAVGPCAVGFTSGDANRVGNLVFSDVDGDGMFEPADGNAGLAGVTVELWHDADGDGAFEPGGDDGPTPTCSTLTDAAGSYWFSEVSSGPWFVAVADVADPLVSSEGSSSDPTLDHDDNGVAPAPGSYGAVAAIAIDVATGQPTGETTPGGTPGADEAAANAADGFLPDRDSNLTIDFGFTAPEPPAPACVSVGNRVWFDADADGLADDGLDGADATEDGIDDVVVDLLAVADDGSTSPVATTTTADGGYYFFDCVAEGTYRVTIAVDNFADGGPLAGLRSSVDRAEAPDADRVDDGLGRGDGSDGPIVSGDVVLSAGDAPTGEVDKPGPGFDSPTDADADTTIDFGFEAVPEPPRPPQPPAPSAALGDLVWFDADRDGIQDAGEAGVAGVELVLLDDASSELARTSTTDGGRYGFDGLPAGTYIVCVEPSTLPTDTSITVADAGGDHASDSDVAPGGTCVPATDLDDGEIDLTLDLGIVPTVEPPADHDVAVSKSGAVSGDRLVWTIQVENHPSGGASGPIQVTDAVPAGTEVVSVEATGGLVCVVVVDNESTPHQTVECHAESLAAGASAVVTVTTTRPGNVCTVSNTVVVETAGIASDDGATTDLDPSNDSATATVRWNCEQLPVTGSDTGSLVLLALLLAGGGAAVTLWVRRERPVSIADRLA